MTNDSGFLTSHQDLSGYIPRNGGPVMTGWLAKTTDNSNLALCGATDNSKGATIWLYGNDSPAYPGGVRIKLTDSNDGEHLFTLYPDGYAGWNGKALAMKEDTVPRSGGAVISGSGLYRVNRTDSLHIGGGTYWDNGGTVVMRGGLAPSQAGCVGLACHSSTEGRDMTLYPSGTWTWDGQAVQLISDQRLKQQITQIDNTLLDAWEDVDLVQFKYNDAVDQKGDTARLHTGYIVQQIDDACKSHNVDISDYGLYCHEDYPEETEEVEVEQEDGTKTKERKVIREASEHYSLRYTETLVVECAYLRREVSKLKQQNENFEQRLKMLEQYVK